MLVQTRSLSIMGTILESDNSNVGTLGRRIPVEFYAFKKYVNLVDVLIYMIQVGCKIWCLIIVSFPNRAVVSLRMASLLDTSEPD